MSGDDYYKILGVDKSTSVVDIKKAYKKLAMKYHPDRNNDDNAEAKFKEISEAYSVLSDPDKRKTYDQFGKSGLQGAGMPHNFNPHDLFADLFSNSSGMPFGNIFTGGFNKANSQPKNQKIAVNITLEESYHGTTKEIPIVIKKKCNSCHATGSKTGKSYICSVCNGKGHQVKSQQLGPFQIAQQIIPCTNCNQQGCDEIPHNDKCNDCNGNKCINKSLTIRLKLQPGMVDNQVITKESCGDYNPKTDTSSNIDFVININNTTFFKREGINLVFTKKITLGESLCGVNFAIKHINNEMIHIKYDQIIKHGESLVCIGYGMPNQHNSNHNAHVNNKKSYGDLIIRFDIIYPINIKDEYKTYLTRMLYTNIKQPACLESQQINNLSEEQLKKLKKINTIKENVQSYSSQNNESHQQFHFTEPTHTEGVQQECHMQ